MATSRHTTPTVIVARTVAPGRERKFDAWVRRLMMQAREAPGYLDSEVQGPNDLHPDEWVIVYRFDTPELLRTWLASPKRAALMAEGEDLVEGGPREQIIAMTPQQDPVTAVSSARVRPGQEQAFLDLHRELLARLDAFEGFLRGDLFEPVDEVQDAFVAVFAFDTREHLDRWLASDERSEILARMEPFVEGPRTLNVLGGFAGWFAPDVAPGVKRWKQAAVVLLALYPTALTLTLLRESLLPGLPLALGVLMVNVVGVGLLTWVLMPFLTTRFDGWLRR